MPPERRGTMDFDSIVHFLHIVGALGYFAAFGLEWASLAYLRRASTAEEARQWLTLRTWVQRLGPASLVVILPSGFYMMATTVGWVGWIIVALAALVLIAILGASLTGPQTLAVEKAISVEHGPLSTTLHQRLGNPRLWTSLLLRTAIALGIVFLMSIKPDLVGSLATIGIAIALALACSVPLWRRVRSPDETITS